MIKSKDDKEVIRKQKGRVYNNKRNELLLFIIDLYIMIKKKEIKFK